VCLSCVCCVSVVSGISGRRSPPLWFFNTSIRSSSKGLIWCCAVPPYLAMPLRSCRWGGYNYSLSSGSFRESSNWLLFGLFVEMRWEPPNIRDVTCFSSGISRRPIRDSVKRDLIGTFQVSSFHGQRVYVFILLEWFAMHFFGFFVLSRSYSRKKRFSWIETFFF
jgi:hypothetical protein